jgi:hypothetical protein
METMKKMDPEKQRKNDLIVYALLIVALFGALTICWTGLLNTITGWASYGLETIADLEAAESLEFPLNETRSAKAMSELSLVFSFVTATAVALSLAGCFALGLGVWYISEFVRIYRRIPKLKERVKKLEEALKK